MFGLVIWACSLLGVSCGPATDSTVLIIRRLTNFESESSGRGHDSELKVVEANATTRPALAPNRAFSANFGCGC